MEAPLRLFLNNLGTAWGSGGTLTGKTATGNTDTGPVYRRFHGSVKVDPIRIGRDTNKIADEVVQHFNALTDADIEVTLEISVKLRNGASEKICTGCHGELSDFEIR